MDKTIVDTVFEMSDKIDNNRTVENILTHTSQELGELAEEVQIEMGNSYKTGGIDGVLGEAVDLIICALDMIHVHHPHHTEEDILPLVQSKLNKWYVTEKQMRCDHAPVLVASDIDVSPREIPCRRCGKKGIDWSNDE
jgi:NTP pyrophosphatase (non-canonical NTP hydrolase)